MGANYKSTNNNYQRISILSNNGIKHLVNEMNPMHQKCTPTSISTNSNSLFSAARSSFLSKSTIFRSAASAVMESSHYCNTILHQQEYSPSRYHRSKFASGYYEQLKQHSSNAHHVIHGKYNAPFEPNPYINKPSSLRNKKNNEDYQQQHQQRQPILLTSEPRILLQSNSSINSYSTDKHYQHYYSYYYNSLPKTKMEQKNIKLPSGFKISARNMRNLSSANTTQNSTGHDCIAMQSSHQQKTLAKYQKQSIVGKSKNSTVPVDHYVVLKEKMPNNIIVNNSNGDQLTYFNADADIINATQDFMDVKDIDAYNKMLHFTNAMDIRVQTLRECNHKVRTSLESETTESATVKPHRRCLCQQIPKEKETDGNKLNQPQLHMLKGGVHIKRQSPPVHRVPIYDNQSPRLRRLSPSNLTRSKRQECRKSPPFPARNMQFYNHSVIENSRKESVDCYVRVMKSLDSQVTYECTDILEKFNEAKTLSAKPSSASTVDDGNYMSSDDDDFDDLDNVSNFGDSEKGSTSDSEDGYRAYAYKMAHSLGPVSTSQPLLSLESSTESLVNPISILVPSLFPNVPPYIAFSTNISKGPKVPPELYRVLKWRVTSVMPKVVRCVLANSGMRLLKKTNDWMGIWGKHMKSPCFKSIRPYQKINHLPGSFKIGRKDACWKNLQKQMQKHGKKDFGFMPKTYIIPHDLNILRKQWPKYAQSNVKWIIKPPASARGTGIRVVDRWAQIPKRRPLIVQKYIERPLLINGSKFDLRLYVLVTSINPLRVYLYHNGLARFASVKYSDRSDTLNDRCMHLTNYSINKFSSNYSKNEDVNACHGHKWTIKSLLTYLTNRGVRTDCLWDALRNLVLRTILAGENSINNMIRNNMESKYSCFELFGFDVLLDAELIPWLLEVNISPSLHSELPLDAHVKAPLVQSVLNTALFHVPPKLSLETQKGIATELCLPPGSICYDKRMYINYLSHAEKIKHTTFTRKSMEDRDDYIFSILENLTPDDVRCLIVAEDELARSFPLERIFPTSKTYKYLKYTESSRYYNRLLDAWENRYANNRAKGISLLCNYCEDNYHLEVPPPPAKKAPSEDGERHGNIDIEHSSDDIIHQTEKEINDCLYTSRSSTITN